MNKAKILFLTILLYLGINGIQAQCPASIYNNYRFNEGQGLSAMGISGASINLTNAGWVPGKLQGAVSFNGTTSSKGVLNDNFFNWTANQDFSIEFWFNLKSANTTNMVFIGRDDPVKSVHWWIGVESANLRPAFYLRDNSGIISGVISNNPISVNTWYHIAVVRNNTTNNNFLYINGQLTGSTQVDYTGDFITTQAVTLGLMNFNGTNSFYSNVEMDELVIHNTAITDTDISTHYNSQSTGNEICPVQNPNNGSEAIKILPLGNSITFDTRSNDTRPASQKIGYRLHLYNKLNAAGYNFDFIGSEIAGQDFFTDTENGGFPGITKEQLVTLLQTGYNQRTRTQITNGAYLNFYSPDVILLHIGTNAVNTNITPINQILSIIDDFRTASGKNVKLIISRIINRVTYDPVTTQYNINLENAVIAHNHPDNFILDMENGAGINYSTDMNDNLHPNDAGYQKMASLWFSALTGILDVPSPNFVKAPANLNATAQDNQNVLSWKEYSTNESGFRIERKTGSGAFEQVAEVGAGITSFIDANIFPITKYIYRVYAFNGAVNSVFSNESIVTSYTGNIINLAPGKPVVQSSTSYSGIPERAIDNNTNGAWSAGSVTHTLDQLNPYWEIDLQSNYTINSIEIWNRTDACCRPRLSNYYVFVSDVPFTSGNLNTTLSQSGVWNNFNASYPNPSSTIIVNRSGRYVRVQLSGQSALNLAEVKIFGQQGTPPPPTQPAAPTALNAQSVTASGASLNWTDNSSNENGFRLERKTGNGEFSHITEVAANITTFNDAGLQSSTDYTYRVYAFNDVGNSTFSNELLVQTLSGVPITNLAPGRPVIQSSTLYSGVPTRAIDNNTNGAWSANSVTHTNSELNPYWQIDLQDIYTISNIEIWNRTDACCRPRLSNNYVFVSDVPFTSGDLNTTLSQSGVWNNFNASYPNPSSTITVNRSGRYIRVQLSGQSVLHLAEVKIFGQQGSQPPPTLPSAPTTLNAQAVSSSGISLTWSDNSSNENGFRLERKTGSGEFSQIAEVAANIKTYSDAGLQSLTDYTYRVYAFNDVGNSTFSNELLVQTPSGDPITNLAPGKPVIQSSTLYAGVPERAIDNNTNGAWSANSVIHTNSELNPYWQIDLQDIYTVNNLEIWNRTDACCRARLSNYYLFVSDVPFTSVDLNTTLSQSGVWSSLNTAYPNPSSTINVNRSGRYIRVQLANLGVLNIAEVRIFGSTAGTSTLKSLSEYAVSSKQIAGSGSEILDNTSIRVYPNPSAGEVNIEFDLDSETKGSISVVNVMGIEQKLFSEKIFSPGNHIIKWNGSDNDALKPATGLYVIKIVLNDQIILKKVFISSGD